MCLRFVLISAQSSSSLACERPSAGNTRLHSHTHHACAQLQASPLRPLRMAAHMSEVLTYAVCDTKLAGQEVKASSKKAQDSAADTVERAQRELQEERGRSKRLLEAARAGSMATQSAGGALACCCNDLLAGLLSSGRCCLECSAVLVGSHASVVGGQELVSATLLTVAFHILA